MAKSKTTKKAPAKKTTKKKAPAKKNVVKGGLSKRAHDAIDKLFPDESKETRIIKICFIPGKGRGPWPECQHP